MVTSNPDRIEYSLEIREKLFSDICSEAEFNVDFCVRIVSSCLIATLGLIGNSGAVIIGAMLLAPLMLPLRGVALGALEGKIEVIWKSLQAIILGTVIALLLAIIVARLYGTETYDYQSIEIFSRTRPGINDLCLAIIAGAVGGYAAVNPKFSDTAAGTAIAVALMPPICMETRINNRFRRQYKLTAVLDRVQEIEPESPT